MDNVDTLVLGGGCFWCIEAVFQRIPGVISVTPGFAGGETSEITYEQVCTGKTGFIEVVKIEFIPSKVSLTKLLQVFFSAHDPTTLNAQGADVGQQYASVIFYADGQQKEVVEKYIDNLEKSAVYSKPIVTLVKPLVHFVPAGIEHWDYFNQHPEKAYCQLVIKPKLSKLGLG